MCIANALKFSHKKGISLWKEISSSQHIFFPWHERKLGELGFLTGKVLWNLFETNPEHLQREFQNIKSRTCLVSFSCFACTHQKHNFSVNGSKLLFTPAQTCCCFHFRGIEKEKALGDASDLIFAVQNERNLILLQRMFPCRGSLINATDDGFKSTDSHETTSLPDKDFAADNTSQQLENILSVIDHKAETLDRTSTSTPSPLAHEESPKNQTGFQEHHDSYRSNVIIDEHTNTSFCQPYVIQEQLLKAWHQTDTSVEIFRNMEQRFPGWPDFSGGNPFAEIRLLTERDNVTMDSVWELYANQTNALRHCPLLKGTHRDFRLESGNNFLLAFLRTGLPLLQDTTALMLLSFLSNSTQTDSLLKATQAQMYLSLALFFTPNQPCTMPIVLKESCQHPDLQRPSSQNELLNCVLSDVQFLSQLRQCELSLRNDAKDESERQIQTLYEKVTLEILLVFAAFLIVPSILYSFTEVSRWITLYVSELEERNSTLAEKTAELDKEKGLTEKLLYEVQTYSYTITYMYWIQWWKNTG